MSGSWYQLARIKEKRCYILHPKSQVNSYIDKSNWVWTVDAFLGVLVHRLVHVLVFLPSFIFISLRVFFHDFSCVMDQPTNRWTDQWMDKPSYRDARTHLKSLVKELFDHGSWAGRAMPICTLNAIYHCCNSLLQFLILL